MATGRIDINTASADDFEQLIGIGRQKAEAIVKHRKVSIGLSVELGSTVAISRYPLHSKILEGKSEFSS